MDIRLNNVVQAWFVNRHPARVQCRNLCVILINARYLMTEIGNARPRHETDIASPNHGNPHTVSTPCDFMKNRKTEPGTSQKRPLPRPLFQLFAFSSILCLAHSEQRRGNYWVSDPRHQTRPFGSRKSLFHV